MPPSGTAFESGSTYVAIKVSLQAMNERTKGHLLDEGIEANRTTDDAPSRDKGEGNETLFPQRRVRRHNARERMGRPRGETTKVFMVCG